MTGIASSAAGAWLSRLFSRFFSREERSLPREDAPSPPGVVAMRAVVGAEHVVTMDGECVDTAGDYEAVVRNLVKISGGALTCDRVVCTEEPPHRRLVLHCSDAIHSRLLEGDTDWIDPDGLIAILNGALRDARGRFVVFDAGASDQSVSFAYLTRAQADALEGRVTIRTPLKSLWKPTQLGPIPLHTHDPGSSHDVVLAVSADGALVASAGGDEVRVWDRAAHTERAALPFPGASAIAFDARGELLVGTKAGVRRGSKTLGTRAVAHVATDRARKVLVVGALEEHRSSPSSWVEVWSLETDTKLAEWQVGAGNIRVAISAEGDLVAAAGELDTCAVWSLHGERRFEHAMKGPVWGVGFSPDGAHVAFGSESGSVVVRATADGSVVKRHRAHSVWSLAWGPDNESIAVAGATGVQLVGPKRTKLPGGEGVEDLSCVAWLPDGGVVAVGCAHAKRGRVNAWPNVLA